MTVAKPLEAGTAPPVTSSAPTYAARRRMVRLFDYGLYATLVVLILYFSLASPYFATAKNLLNIGDGIAETGIVAAGMTIGLVAGLPDLSVGAVIGLTSVIIAHLATIDGWAIVPAILMSLAACVLVGLINGFLIVRVNINPIIATLATTTVITGTALIIAGGQVIPLPAGAYEDIVIARPGGIPLTLIVMLLVFGAGYVFLRHTRAGWHTYAVGGNVSASVRAGLPARKIFVGILITTALLAGFSSVITTGILQSAQGNYGTGEELDILTACLLGGVGLEGGAGRIERVLAGVLLIGVLSNGLTLLDVDSFYQQVARGVVLVLAVILDAIRRKMVAR